MSPVIIAPKTLSAVSPLLTIRDGKFFLKRPEAPCSSKNKVRNVNRNPNKAITVG